MKDEDGQVVEYEVLGTNFRESVFKKSVPILHPWLAVWFCLLNIVPGQNIQLSSIFSHDRRQVLERLLGLSPSSAGPRHPLTPAWRWTWWHGMHSIGRCVEGFLVGVGTALLQLGTSLVVFGWYWSIMWDVSLSQQIYSQNFSRHGVHFIQKANEFAKKGKENEEQVIV